MSKFCANCGSRIAERASFCSACGKPVAGRHPAREDPAPTAVSPRPVAPGARPAPSRHQNQKQQFIAPPRPSSAGDATTGVPLPNEQALSAAAEGIKGLSAKAPGLVGAGKRWLTTALGSVRAPHDARAMLPANAVTSGSSPEGSAASKAQALPTSNLRTYLALALFVAALLTSGQADTNSSIVAKILLLLWLIAAPLLVVSAAKPSLVARLPYSAWLQRPRLGTLSAAVFVLATSMLAGFTFPFFVAAAGTAIFLSDASRRGELGNFRPRQLLRGWRMLILAGVLLASFTFTTMWIGDYDYSNVTITDNYDGTETWTTNSGTYDGSTAHDLGITTPPTLLMIGLLAWAAWRPAGGRIARWQRFVPAALAAALVAWGILRVIAEQRYRAGMPENHSSMYGSGYSALAEGPTWFAICLIPLCIGVLALTLKRDPWSGKPGA